MGGDGFAGSVEPRGAAVWWNRVQLACRLSDWRFSPHAHITGTAEIAAAKSVSAIEVGAAPAISGLVFRGVSGKWRQIRQVRQDLSATNPIGV